MTIFAINIIMTITW